MKTFRFKDFIIYREAKIFRRHGRELLMKFPPEEKFRSVDQINRSLLSILLNIAEGSAKRSDKEFARYLESSIASVNESVAGFDVSCDDGLISSHENEAIEQEAEHLAKQIGGFIQTLRRNKNPSQ